MPEQKMTYQERVDDEVGEVSNSTEHWLWTQRAKRNIAAQAEAIREALWKFYEDGEMRDDVDENMLSYLINEHLNDHGYIEPKTEDDGV